MQSHCALMARSARSRSSRNSRNQGGSSRRTPASRNRTGNRCRNGWSNTSGRAASKLQWLRNRGGSDHGPCQSTVTTGAPAGRESNAAARASDGHAVAIPCTTTTANAATIAGAVRGLTLKFVDMGHLSISMLAHESLSRAVPPLGIRLRPSNMEAPPMMTISLHGFRFHSRRRRFYKIRYKPAGRPANNSLG